jgi:predicted solute-binding protein
MEVLMYRFAVLPYCNAAPLVYYISDFCPSTNLVEKYPREMSDELKSDRVDAALIPIVDFLSDEKLRMVPGLRYLCRWAGRKCIAAVTKASG